MIRLRVCEEVSRMNEEDYVFLKSALTDERHPNSVFCEEVSRMNEEDHVFLKSAVTDELHLNSVVKQLSVKERIMALLLHLKHMMEGVLVQFWASSGGGALILEEPFCTTGVYEGFWAYRSACIQAELDGNSPSLNGPIERVFARGYPEYCKSIDSYSIEEFPMKGHAKLCGFSDYMVLPVFDHDQQCFGVLEFLLSGANLHSVMKSLEGSEFDYSFPHWQECAQVGPHKPMSTTNASMLRSIREEHQSPLIQIWVPCICVNTMSFTQLICRKRSINLTMDNASENLHLSLLKATYSVRGGKSWVGRAYSEQKACFCRNTRQISISDYPLALITRSSGQTGLLTNCCSSFAIPLQLIHPDLAHLVFEVFLPNCDADIEGVLRSLLITLAQELEKSNVALGLKENEVFGFKYSHSDDENYDYFDVFRSSGTAKKAVGNGSPAPKLEDSVADHETRVAHPKRVDTSALALTHAEISLDPTRNDQEVVVTAGSRDGDPVRTQEMLLQVPKPSDTNDMSSLHDLAKTLKKTLNAINQYCSSREMISPAEKRVTRGTWKCKCRKFGIWLLSSKRKQVHFSARFGSKLVEVGSNVIQETEPVPVAENATPTSESDKSMVMGSDDVEESYSIIVKANYKENVTAKFRLWSNSGIEQLHAELHKRFMLEADKFKVKYQDEDGDWILLCCDEDLRLCMEEQKSSSKSAVRMLVIPVSYKVIR